MYVTVQSVLVLQVVLQKRPSRGYLMGFADLRQDGVHKLYVMYKFNGSFYEMNGTSSSSMYVLSFSETKQSLVRRRGLPNDIHVHELGKAAT
jgi:hypothetical protein